MDISLALAHSIPWAMSIVQAHKNSTLSINIDNLSLTSCEKYLLSRIQESLLFTISKNWCSTKETISFVHCENILVPLRKYELRLYEDFTSAIAAIFDSITNEMMCDTVLIFWVKDNLDCYNPGYGLGSNPGTYRFDEMKRVL